MELFKSFSKEKKAKVLAMAKEHREADRFVQGTWLKDGRDSKGMHRGCFFGCMTQCDDNVLITACNELEIPALLKNNGVNEAIISDVMRKHSEITNKHYGTKLN